MHDQRSRSIPILAANLSGGTSNSEIKDMVINIVKDHEIRGRILDFGAGKGELINSLAHMDGIDCMELTL